MDAVVLVQTLKLILGATRDVRVARVGVVGHGLADWWAVELVRPVGAVDVAIAPPGVWDARSVTTSKLVTSHVSTFSLVTAITTIVLQPSIES